MILRGRMRQGAFELDSEGPDIALSRFRFRERGRFAYLVG